MAGQRTKLGMVPYPITYTMLHINIYMPKVHYWLSARSPKLKLVQRALYTRSSIWRLWYSIAHCAMHATINKIQTQSSYYFQIKSPSKKIRRMNLSDLTRMQNEHHLFISLITNSQKCVWHHNAAIGNRKIWLAIQVKKWKWKKKSR